MITRDLASSGLFVAEATRVPSNRYRLTQIVAALADHEASSVRCRRVPPASSAATRA